MTIKSVDIALTATTPAQHHDWIAAFSGALDFLNVTQTADTGQVDLTTGSIDLPPENSGGNASDAWSSPPVYQIRKLSAAGLPDLFMRIEFGVFGNNNSNGTEVPYNYPAIKVALGKGTDGAGNLINIQSTGGASFGSHSSGSTPLFNGSSAPLSGLPSSVAQSCDFASDGQNYLTIMMGENAPTYENYSVFCFGVERTIDPLTGNYDGDGAMAVCGHGYNDTWWYSDFNAAREWYGSGNVASLSPPFNIAGAGDDILLFPLYGCTTVPKGSPTIAVAYYTASISAPVSFPAEVLSVPHTYKACPRSTTIADAYSTGTKLALRFD